MAGETERHLLPHGPDGYHGQGWTKIKAGTLSMLNTCVAGAQTLGSSAVNVPRSSAENCIGSGEGTRPGVHMTSQN